MLGIVCGAVPLGLALDNPAVDLTPRLNVGEDQALQELGLVPALDRHRCFADRHAALLRGTADRAGKIRDQLAQKQSRFAEIEATLNGAACC